MLLWVEYGGNHFNVRKGFINAALALPSNIRSQPNTSSDIFMVGDDGCVI
jgi:hypothetical protein